MANVTFDVNPTSTAEVTIAAASSGNRARWVAFGFSNDGTTQRTLIIRDGAAGTVRIRKAIAPGAGEYLTIREPGDTLYPKAWWTAGNAIVAELDASGSMRLFGEIVREV